MRPSTSHKLAGSSSRILAISPSLGPSGGTERLFREDLKELSSFAQLTLLAPLSQRLNLSGVSYLPTLTGSTFLPFSWELWATQATLITILSRKRFPVRYSPGMNAFGVTHTTVHCCFRWMVEIYREFERRLRLAFRYQRLVRFAFWEKKFFMVNPPQVLCLTQLAERILNEYYPNLKTFYLPPPLEYFIPSEGFASEGSQDLRKKLGIPPGTSLIVLVGNDFRIKGGDLFLKILKGFLSRRVWGILVGRESPQLISASTGIPVPKNLIYLPRIYPIEPLYRAADLVLLPSRGELLGLPPLEAYALGTKVLVSSLCGASEFLPKECVVPSLDTDHWIEAVRQALEEGRGNPVKPLSLPERSKRSLEFYKWLTAGT